MPYTQKHVEGLKKRGAAWLKMLHAAQSDNSWWRPHEIIKKTELPPDDIHNYIFFYTGNLRCYYWPPHDIKAVGRVLNRIIQDKPECEYKLERKLNNSLEYEYRVCKNDTVKSKFET